jgi:hypothetical protein
MMELLLKPGITQEAHRSRISRKLQPHILKVIKNSSHKIMGERREKRKKNNKSYQEFQTSQPPKIVGGCNCNTYVAT